MSCASVPDGSLRELYLVSWACTAVACIGEHEGTPQPHFLSDEEIGQPGDLNALLFLVEADLCTAVHGCNPFHVLVVVALSAGASSEGLRGNIYGMEIETVPEQCEWIAPIACVEY